MRKNKKTTIIIIMVMAGVLFIAFLARFFNVLKTNLDIGMLALLGIMVLLILFPFLKEFELFKLFKIKFR